MGEEFVSCSKKCKKVTKFAYMLRQNNEQEILRAFESMLRKKARKSNNTAKQLGYQSGYRHGSTGVQGMDYLNEIKTHGHDLRKFAQS